MNTFLSLDEARKARAINRLNLPHVDGDKIVSYLKERAPISNFPHYERKPFTILTLSTDRIFIIFKRVNRALINKGTQSSVVLAFDYNEETSKVYYRTHIFSAVDRLNDTNEMKVRETIKGLPGVCHFEGFHYYVKNDRLKRGAIADYYPEGDLLHILLKRRFSEIEQKRVMQILLETLKSLHALNVIHRDLKLENIFLKNGLPIIGDFGYASLDDNNPALKTALASLSYAAPEVIAPHVTNLTLVVGKFNDIWALGCVFFAIINNLMIIRVQSKADLNNVYFGVMQKIDQNQKLRLKENEIVKKMLVFDYKLRPKAVDLIGTV